MEQIRSSLQREAEEQVDNHGVCVCVSVSVRGHRRQAVERQEDKLKVRRKTT